MLKAACDLLPDNICDCHLKHSFDTQVLLEFVQKSIVNTTNAQAAAEDAGHRETVYRDYKLFDLTEVYKMIGLLFVNGPSPQPLFKMWFQRHNIFGNKCISKAVHKQMPCSQQAIHGFWRWKHFRLFMWMFDFCEDAKKETGKNPQWKINISLMSLITMQPGCGYRRMAQH